MSEEPTLRDELIASRKEPQRKNKTPIDQHETIIIIAALIALTAALMTNHLSESSFKEMIGPFIGYVFGRILNGWQGKE